MAGPESVPKSIALQYGFLALGLFGNGLITVFLAGPAILLAMFATELSISFLVVAAMGHVVASATFAASEMRDEWDEMDHPSVVKVLNARRLTEQDQTATSHPYTTAYIIILLGLYTNAALIGSMALGAITLEIGYGVYAPIVVLGAPIADRMLFDMTDYSPATAVILAAAWILSKASGTRIDARRVIGFSASR